MRVCVADDHTETASVLCEGLRLLEYEAIPAYSGLEALEICRSQPIDLILLDVLMPDVDGYEVCKRLKEDPKTRDIVVIFVTVKGSRQNIATGYALGAADYITKPFNLPMVMVRVEAALRRREGEDLADRLGQMSADHDFTDQLTGLRNRDYLLERLHEEVEKAHRYNYPLSCVVFDVTDVQALDEELGPVSLDDLLVEIGMAVRSYSRICDIVARYDGTVLASVLPHCPLDDAIAYATKIMSEVEATIFSDPNFPTQARLSVGIATCHNGRPRDAEYILGEAMRGLLQAKSRKHERRIVARNLAST